MAEVHDNVANNNGEFGIVLSTGATAEVHDNMANNNGAMGIAVFDSSATLVQNVLQGNHEFGILLAGEVIAEVVDNTITDNDSCDIGVIDGAVAAASARAMQGASSYLTLDTGSVRETIPSGESVTRSRSPLA